MDDTTKSPLGSSNSESDKAPTAPAPQLEALPGEAPDPKPAIRRFKHGPNGPRTATEKGERPVGKEERLALLGTILEGLDALFAAHAIDKRERDNRRRAAKDALNASCLLHCAACDVIYGRGACPGCGSLDTDESAKWDYDPAVYRRLASRLTTDLLRVEGPAKSSWEKRAAETSPGEPSLDDMMLQTFGPPRDDDPSEDELLARREELLAIWKDPKWWRPIVPAELEWRIAEVEMAINGLCAAKVIAESDRDRRLKVARTWLRAPLLTLCGCGYCHAQEKCPICHTTAVEATREAAGRGAPPRTARWSESPAVYQMLLAELWWDLTRTDGIQPLSCARVSASDHSTAEENAALAANLFGDESDESPMAHMPPEPLPDWEPSAKQRGAARGLGLIE